MPSLHIWHLTQNQFQKCNTEPLYIQLRKLHYTEYKTLHSIFKINLDNLDCSVRKGVLADFANLTEKHLCLSLHGDFHGASFEKGCRPQAWRLATLLKKDCLKNILKTSRKNVHRVMGHPEDVKFEPHLQMHFHYIIFYFISPNVCLKH